MAKRSRVGLIGIVLVLVGWSGLPWSVGAVPPVCSNAEIRFSADYAFVVGSSDFSDPDGDAESGSLYRFLVNGVPLAAAQPVAEGLLLHFDGSAAGANGENPVQSQGVGFAAGKWGQALTLSAGGMLAFSRQDNFFPAEGSVEMWAALRADGSDPVYSTTWQVLFYYEAPNGDTLYVAQSEQSGILYAGGSVNGQWQSAYGPAGNMRSWKAGEWHHLAFTYSAAQNFMRFYVDGALAADTNEGHYRAPSAGGSEIHIGGTPWGTEASYFLDEVRLSGRVPSAGEIAARARRLDQPRANEVWLPTSGLAPGDRIAFEFTPKAAGEAGLPCTTALLGYPGIPIVNPQPVSTLLPPGSASMNLSVETNENATCAYAVGAPLPYAQMTPFDQEAGTKLHRTVVAGLNPDPNQVNTVYVRSSAYPDFLLTLLYRSLSTVNPSYPRTGNLWGWWDFADKGLAYIARIDLWLGAPIPPDEIRELRALNPDILVLTSINAVENSGLPADYYLKDVNGKRIEVWPGSFRLNLTKSYVAEYQARFAYQLVLDSGMMLDGVFFDNVMTTQSWLTRDIYGNPVELDANEDGQPDDAATLDAAWKAGVFHELQTFRDLMPSALVSSHSTDIYEPGIAQIFNGNSLGFLTADALEGERSFLDVWDRYNAWISLAKPPALTMIESTPIDQFAYGYDYSPWDKVPQSTIEFAHTYYPWMRFGLALTLMNDGYFAQEWGDTWHGNDWWYDELDFDLGRPLGPAERTDTGFDPGPNRMENESFESAIAFPWGFWANAAAGCAATVTQDTTTAAQGTASARVDITATSGVDWHIELAQYNRSIDQGVRYDLKFFAKADHQRFITLASQKGAPNWDPYGLWARVQIDTGWKEYTVSFEATATAGDARIQFELGEETGTVWIDHVRLTLHSPDVFRREFTNGVALLNACGQSQQVTLGPGYRRLTGAQAPFFETILDDDSGTGFQTAGTWDTPTYDSGEWQAAGPFYHNWGGCVHELSGAAGEASWELPVPAADAYTVSAWWPAAPSASGWTRSALYEVVVGGSVVASATLDQTTGGDEWHEIAEVLLSPADQPYVRLTCTGGVPCIADALYIRSRARYNDGSQAASVLLGPMDGIVLRRDGPADPTLAADAGAGATLCRGESSVLGGSPAASGGTPPYGIAWNPVEGLDNPAALNPTATPDMDTVYTLTVIDSKGSTAQDSVLMTIYPNNPPVDAGNSLTLLRNASDIDLAWARTGLFGYSVMTSDAKDFSNPQALFPDIPGESAKHTNGVPPAGGKTLRLYRVETLGCHH